jgi:hypothetical protein
LDEKLHRVASGLKNTVRMPHSLTDCNSEFLN